ncbi:hypothetical protein pipiens_010362 [Culex pipiens pipiens]|uniref:Uncharacterized protein n=1 Tax=Culex pipiens pipiens TaxID=38569 RepID=A0ABD1DAH1_CULPP
MWRKTMTGILKEIRVKVFNFPSRNASMVVAIDKEGADKSTAQLAQELLGSIVYVSWPHLTEAKVVKVADAKTVYEKDREERQNNEKFFGTCVKAIVEHHSNRLAIDLGEIRQLVHVKTCVGSEYVLKDDRYVLNKLWNQGETMYPVQAIVTDLREALRTLKPYQEVQEMFPENCVVFLRATQWYGSMGHVVDVTAGHKRIKTRFEIYEEPNLDTVLKIDDEARNHYLTTYDAASSIGISANLLSRLSSTIYMVTGGRRSLNVDEKGKMNIGLQLRLVSQDIETVGYTRKMGKNWMYSDKAIELVKAYYDKVPQVFEKLESFGNRDVLFEDEIFGEKREEGSGLKELVAWIKAQDHAKAEKRSCGTKILEPAAVEELVKVTAESVRQLPTMQTMFVHPKDLYKPGMKQAKSIDYMANYELLDRVIIARETEVVPLGYRGTIIGIHLAKDPNPIRQESVSKEDKYFDILFDKQFPNGTHIFGIEQTRNRVVRVAEGAILNISFGVADFEYKQVDPAQPIMLPAEEFCPGGLASKQPSTARSVETVRVKPSKPTAKSESIKKRLNERIEKNPNPMKAFVMANRKPLEENGANSQAGCDFEKVWNKLREPNQPTTTTLDERDIKSFLANAAPAAQESTSVPTNPPAPSSDPTDMLKKMLKISADQEPAVQTPPQLNIPMPKNLPKPPSSWRSDHKSAKDTAKQQPADKPQQKPIQNHHPMPMPPQPFAQFQPYQLAHQQNRYPPPPGQFLPNHSTNITNSSSSNSTGPNTTPETAPTTTNQHHPRQRGPNGPQNLSFNRNTPAGTGAFVPLQAIIKSKTRPNGGGNKSNKAGSSSSNANSTGFAQKNAELRQKVEQKQQENKQDFASFLGGAGKSAEAVATATGDEKCDKPERKKDDGGEGVQKTASTSPKPPKVRQMRIAANFSQAD